MRFELYEVVVELVSVRYLVVVGKSGIIGQRGARGGGGESCGHLQVSLPTQLHKRA